ncbi:50S ribosomal protein L6 [Candidatus Palauibacter sp.]|uniref:50S ribosomal protein L6 n=1 Tax=Candidatus Palauibacter sp. TaxID=3101350 RepID=UPI003AF209A0
MSRIGKLPIPVPDGVDVRIDGQHVRVEGPRGELARSFDPDMTITLSDGLVSVARSSDEARQRALHGLTRSLIANMVTGVSEGYEKRLEIHGVGYKAEQKGETLVFSVGYSHTVAMEPPSGVAFGLESPTLVKVMGIDKEKVGQMAAEIRAIRPPEPYKGKGIRYVGEHVRRKAGKATAAS